MHLKAQGPGDMDTGVWPFFATIKSHKLNLHKYHFVYNITQPQQKPQCYFTFSQAVPLKHEDTTRFC